MVQTMGRTFRVNLRILLWLLMLAGGSDKDGNAISIPTFPSFHPPTPRHHHRHRHRLLMDPFPQRPASSVPFSGVIGYQGASGPSFHGYDDASPVATSQSGEPSSSFYSLAVYPGFGAGRTSSPGAGGGRGFARFPPAPPGSPFKTLFGSDIERPSGIYDSFGTVARKEKPIDIVRSPIARSDFRSYRNHPFSSIRLTPINQVSGITVAGPSTASSSTTRGRGDFVTDRSLPGTLRGSNRAHSFQHEDPFERPISRSAFALPGINDPITLDLAGDEWSRVKYAKEKRRLPPPRNAVTGNNNNNNANNNFRASFDDDDDDNDNGSDSGRGNLLTLKAPSDLGLSAISSNNQLRLPAIPALPSEKVKQKDQNEFGNADVPPKRNQDQEPGITGNADISDPLAVTRMDSSGVRINSDPEIAVGRGSKPDDGVGTRDSGATTATTGSKNIEQGPRLFNGDSENPPNIHTYMNKQPERNSDNFDAPIRESSGSDRRESFDATISGDNFKIRSNDNEKPLFRDDVGDDEPHPLRPSFQYDETSEDADEKSIHEQLDKYYRSKLTPEEYDRTVSTPEQYDETGVSQKESDRSNLGPNEYDRTVTTPEQYDETGVSKKESDKSIMGPNEYDRTVTTPEQYDETDTRQKETGKHTLQPEEYNRNTFIPEKSDSNTLTTEEYNRNSLSLEELDRNRFTRKDVDRNTLTTEDAGINTSTQEKYDSTSLRPEEFDNINPAAPEFKTQPNKLAHKFQPTNGLHKDKEVEGVTLPSPTGAQSDDHGTRELPPHLATGEFNAIRNKGGKESSGNKNGKLVETPVFTNDLFDPIPDVTDPGDTGNEESLNSDLLASQISPPSPGSSNLRIDRPPIGSGYLYRSSDSSDNKLVSPPTPRTELGNRDHIENNGGGLPHSGLGADRDSPEADANKNSHGNTTSSLSGDFFRGSEEREHITLDNLNEYLEKGEDTNENNDVSDTKDVATKGIDDIMTPDFKDYNYDTFGPSKSDSPFSSFKGNGKTNSDDFSINTNPSSLNFDLLKVGEQSINVRKVSNTFDPNHKEINIVKTSSDLSNPDPKGIDTIKSSLFSSGTTAKPFPDTFPFSGPSDQTPLPTAKSGSSSFPSKDDDALSPFGGAGGVFKDETGESASKGFEARPGDLLTTSPDSTPATEADDDQYADLFPPPSSYQTIDFPLPSSDAFGSSSAFENINNNNINNNNNNNNGNKNTNNKNNDRSSSAPLSPLRSPFQFMFGKTLDQAERGSFGSLFRNLKPADKEQRGGGASVRSGGRSVQGLGGPAGRLPGGRGVAASAEGGAFTSGRLFNDDLGHIIERRPSLDLFKRKWK